MEQWVKVKVDESSFGWPSTKAFQHLGEEAKADYAGAKAALGACFEPESKQSRYRAELETRCKKREEGCADFAEDLHVLSEKTYPQLNVFLKRISNPLLFARNSQGTSMKR